MLKDLIRFGLGLVLVATALRDWRSGTTVGYSDWLVAAERPLLFKALVIARLVVGTGLLAIVAYDWFLAE